jgi:predicted transcriptional regulator
VSPAEGDTALQDVLEVERPEQLKALGHPLRLKILQVLGESDRALTNRELAGRLAVDPGHLHFHVRMLHRAGLI